MTWLTRKIQTSMAAFVLAGALLTPSVPLQAAPDEAVLENVPYTNQPLAAVTQQKDNNSDVSALYTVRPGDTLSAIAARFGLREEALKEANHIVDSDLIVTGQVLSVPGGIQRHRVADGETLTAIARRCGVDVHTLARVNNLTDADLLTAGREIIIPGGTPAAVPVTAGTNPPPGWEMLPGWNAVAALPLSQLPWPVVGRVSSPFGARDGRPHEGVDIAADEGAPIRAVKDGRVIFAGPRGTYGNAVIIDHGSGLQTLYAHASRVLVQAGQEVKAGEEIALVGNTGRSTGPHLHMEVLLNGLHYDPLLCLERVYA